MQGVQQPGGVRRQVRRQAVQRLLRHVEQLAPGGVARHLPFGDNIGHWRWSSRTGSICGGRASVSSPNDCEGKARHVGHTSCAFSPQPLPK
jgi:hypothetical protein